jgi:putative Mn2+ efflux pump MntP
MSLGILFHNVFEQVKAKVPEITGFAVSFTGFILGMDLLNVINGILQTVVLIGSIAVSVITFQYMRDKRRSLKNENNSNRNG